MIRKYHNRKQQTNPWQLGGRAKQPSRDTSKTSQAKQPALSSKIAMKIS